MSEALAVRGGRVIDPVNGLDAVADVLIVDGRVAAVGPDAGKEARETVDATGLVVCPAQKPVEFNLFNIEGYKELYPLGLFPLCPPLYLPVS